MYRRLKYPLIRSQYRFDCLVAGAFLRLSSKIPPAAASMWRRFRCKKPHASLFGALNIYVIKVRLSATTREFPSSSAKAREGRGRLGME